MDTGVTRSGGTRNRVQHYAATLRLADAQQRRRCASRGTATRSMGIRKRPVSDAMEAVLAEASTPRLPLSSLLLSPSAMIPSVERRSWLITPPSAPSSLLLRSSSSTPIPTAASPSPFGVIAILAGGNSLLHLRYHPRSCYKGGTPILNERQQRQAHEPTLSQHFG